VIGNPTGSDPLQGFQVVRAEKQDRVTGQEQVHGVALLQRRCRYKQTQCCLSRVLGPGMDVDQELRHRALR
jgi:hypothetical protein